MTNVNKIAFHYHNLEHEVHWTYLEIFQTKTTKEVATKRWKAILYLERYLNGCWMNALTKLCMTIM
jgi:hypothetical protein